MGILALKTYKDQLGREVQINGIPQKIISLVPSQTEFLIDLGLEDQIAGITKFCIHPKEVFIRKTRIGGTKKIDFNKIKKLSPDLIICNKEENQKEQIEILMESYPVWVSDIKTLEDAYEMMEKIGEITGREENASVIVNEIKSAFNLLYQSKNPAYKVAYFIWRNPYMVAASDNFIDHMLRTSGFMNVFRNHSLRYPSITIEELLPFNPDLIFLSSEPFPFSEKYIPEFQQAFPKAKIIVVDGEMFSWYGSRLRYAPSYLLQLINNLKTAENPIN